MVKVAVRVAALVERVIGAAAVCERQQCVGGSSVCLQSAEKFTVPPGAYVRSADYYWSFNEFVDSGNNEIFQNTGEYSYGLFNASASLIQQNNDSILNGSTWYTLKFDKLRKQCITIPGFENVNHTCMIDPNQCTDGVSMEVWLKLLKSDLESSEMQTIYAAGNTNDGGHGGYFAYQLGRKVAMLVANGSSYWLVEKNIPNSIQAGQWFNFAFRWRTDLGVQLFINSELAEEIPFAIPKDVAQTPSDNKMYVGCRKHELQLKDFADFEMDELAFWNRYMPDHKVKDFTGAIIPVDDIELTLFKYHTDIELLEPSKPTQVLINPFYEAAHFYEACSSSNADLAHAVVSTTRGLQSAVLLSKLQPAQIPLSESSGKTTLNAHEGCSFAFWILPSMTTHISHTIMTGENWEISFFDSNITVIATYSTKTFNDTMIVTETVTHQISLDIWSNVGVAWKSSVGIQLYINGLAKSDTASVTLEELPTLPLGDDELSLFHSEENISISDIIIWQRYLYDFEAYRFVGMSPSEAYLDNHADLYWSTDYWVSSDKAATKTRLPLYQTINSSVTPISNGGLQGYSNKGQAMHVSSTNGWVMLGLHDNDGQYFSNTGEEFAGTCISDPSVCTEGLTIALWLKFANIADSKKVYSIMTSGEEDLFSRGFSITVQNKHMRITLVDGISYWRVSIQDGAYPVDKWMHLAFSWKADEGLWVFLNGELLAANKEPLLQQRPYDRYSRVTLGRNNANNAFSGFTDFSFQEIAVYFRFIVTYRIRESFALVDNSEYEKAERYYNRDALITSTIDSLLNAKQHNLQIGPFGNVMAFNNTISLGQGGYIILDYLGNTQCITDPAYCTDGVTVSTWTRTNLFIEAGDNVIYLLNSHGEPEKVRNGLMNGWTIYYIGDKFKVTLVSSALIYSTAINELAKKLKEQRWTNIGFTWSPSAGMTLILDGQVAAILKNGANATGGPPSASSPLMVGDPNNGNKTCIAIFNVAIWEKYYFGSRGYELTGHRESVISKYSAADLMWSFDGAIHLINTKFDEMVLRKETYDSSLTGAALQVTRDGLYNASLGNYSSECITEPSSCKSGFQVGAELQLGAYTAGEGADEIGIILLLGSPDANFEGLAIQMLEEEGENKLAILVANNLYVWKKKIAALLDEWFELVIGWNVKDGIAVKINNKKVKGAQEKTKLAYGSSKLVTNKLILGVGSGGGTNQGVDAKYNDITVTYNSEVAIEQEGRCYESAALYYRLDKGQIFTMEDVLYTKDREDFVDSGFVLKDTAYVELDQFIGHCFSDPSICTEGLSLSVYTRVDKLVNSVDTLLCSGYPLRGYRLQVAETGDEADSLTVTVSLNNGRNTWQVEGSFAKKTWVNIAFTWNVTDTSGLTLYIDGVVQGQMLSPTEELQGSKQTRQSLTIGRSNDDSDVDFCDAVFDDIAIWDYDISIDYANAADIGNRLIGKDCGTGDELLVEAEIPELAAPTTMNITEVDNRPPGCTFYDETTGLCARDITEFTGAAQNVTGLKVNGIPEVLQELDQQTSAFVENSTEPTEEFLDGYVDTLGYLNSLPIDEEIDPRNADSSMNNILSTSANMLNPKVWKTKWDEKNENSTKGSPFVLKQTEELCLKFAINRQIGLDKEDDCSSFKGGNSGVVMSSEKRRMHLCSRDYTYPLYDKMAEDETLKSTLDSWNSPTDSVMIPASTWPKEEYPDDAIIAVSVILYNDIDELLPRRMSLGTFVDLEATTSADNPDDVIDTDLVLQAIVNSRIMSVIANPPVKAPLSECVVISMEHTETNTDNKRTPYCAFWDYTIEDMVGGAWSSDGCEVSSSNETHTVCCCYHLTSFAIMMEPLVVEPVDLTAQTKEYMLYSCTGISALSLLVFCFVIICNKSLRSERNMVHLNLSISMILATGSYVAAYFAKDEPVYCLAAAVAQHYLYMVAYAWILVEALCLFYAVLYGQLVGKMKTYIAFAWVLPAGIVALCLALYMDKYGLNDRCWLTYNEYIIMAMLGPVLLCIFLDTMVLLIIICNLPQPTLKREDILSEVRWAVFYAMLLVPYLIFTWLLPLIEVLKVQLAPVYDFVFIAVFGLQGFFCFLVYGLGQRSVRLGFMRKKYQPAYPSSTLLGANSSRASSGLSQPILVPVKPQPMSRPTSRSSKDKSSPQPAPAKIDKPQSTAAHRRASTSSSEGDDSGYIP